MSEENAYGMLILMDGVTSYNYSKEQKEKTAGTGIRLRFQKSEQRPYAGISYPIAGKTGTTQNNSDCGLMGMVRILVTGVWVGGEDRSVHFESTMYGQGATMALPVWALYMKDCYNDERLTISKEEFTVPPNLTIEVDCDKWKEEGKPEDIEEVPDEFDF